MFPSPWISWRLLAQQQGLWVQQCCPPPPLFALSLGFLHSQSSPQVAFQRPLITILKVQLDSVVKVQLDSWDDAQVGEASLEADMNVSNYSPRDSNNAHLIKKIGPIQTTFFKNEEYNWLQSVELFFRSQSWPLQLLNLNTECSTPPVPASVHFLNPMHAAKFINVKLWASCSLPHMARRLGKSQVAHSLSY